MRTQPPEEHDESHNDLADPAQTNNEANAEMSNTPTADKASEAIDNLLSNLDEDNANSLPSTGGTTTSDAYRRQQSTTSAADNSMNGMDDTAGDEPSSSLATNSSAGNTIAFDRPNGQQSATVTTATIGDAEMVSEDELPVVRSSSAVPPAVHEDAEEVSDEELPGPRMAELPADTEVVSEDELPLSSTIASTPSDASTQKAQSVTAKRKVAKAANNNDKDYDPDSPTQSSELPEKRLRAETTGRTSTTNGEFG